MHALGLPTTQGMLLTESFYWDMNDMFVKNGKIREDGRMMREMYLFEVKKPSESKYPWDYCKLKATVPAEQAFQPPSKSSCPLVKK